MNVRGGRIPRLLATLLALLLSSCRIQENPRTTRPSQVEVAREQIATTLEAYRNALIEGDANAVSDVFTSGGVIAAPDTEDVVGTAAIRRAMRELFAAADVTDVFTDRAEIHVAGDVAFETGTFEQSVSMGEQPPVTVRGRYAITWQRIPEAEWRIQHMLINHLPADSAAGERTPESRRLSK